MPTDDTNLSFAEQLDQANAGDPVWEYQKIAPLPEGLLRTLATLGGVDRLEAACRQALKTGQPISEETYDSIVKPLRSTSARLWPESESSTS